MEEGSKIGIVLLAIFGIATVVGALVLLSGKGAGTPTGAGKGGYRIVLKPNRAIGSSDYKTINYTIYRSNAIVDNGSITDISACNPEIIMKSEVPVGTYKIVIQHKDTVTERVFEVKPNMTVVVEVEYEVAEIITDGSYLTIEIKSQPNLVLYERSLIDSNNNEVIGVVNCNTISFPLKFGSNIKEIRLCYKETQQMFEKVYSNVRFTKGTKLITGVVLQEDEGHITFEAMVYDRGLPLKDCKVIVYKGENPIIEKDAVEIEDGIWGIREVIERTGDSYTVYVKNKTGTETYATLGDIVLSGKITGVYLERVYKWR